MPNPTYNIRLMIDVNPNPLCGNLGKHTVRCNNNNSWIAQITPMDIQVENPASAELDLVVNGSPTAARMQVPVGNVAQWQQSHPIDTDLQPRSNATSSGERVSVSCCISRVRVSPKQPPLPAFLLDDVTLVKLF
jgi:hypothetical protein